MSNSNVPPVNPIMKAILAAGRGDVVELLGFIGEGPDGFVRVYRSLALSVYVDVPAGDLVHVIPAERATDPTRLLVLSSSRVTVTVRNTATLEARELVRGRASYLPGGLRNTGEYLCFRTCAYSFEDCLEATNGNYALCSQILDECNERCEEWFPRFAGTGRCQCGGRARSSDRASKHS